MAAVDEQMSYTPELFLSRECEPHLPASLVDLSAHAQYVKVHLLPKKVLLKITKSLRHLESISPLGMKYCISFLKKSNRLKWQYKDSFFPFSPFVVPLM